MNQSGFSVVSYLEDGTTEHVSRSLDIDRAVELFSTCVSAASTKRVIVTNGNVHLEGMLIPAGD